MIKSFVIFLSSLILLQSLNIGLESFSKVKVLLEHAQFHQEEYGDSFIDFLTEHYGEKDLSSNTNHEEYKDLPFKKNSQTYSHLISDFNFNNIVFELKNKIILDTKPNYFYKEPFSLHEKASVFQPPKNV